MPLSHSISKSRRHLLRDLPHDTPAESIDLYKTVKDSLRGVIWERDCQICSLVLNKIVVDHHTGCTLIRVQKIEQVKTDSELWSEYIRERMDFSEAYATIP